jgi:hypothetical protein
MTRETSEKVLHLMFELGAALDRSVAEVRATETAEELKAYQSFVSKVLTDVQLKFVNPICASYPELKPTQLYRPGEKVPPAAKPYFYRGLPPPAAAEKKQG